MKKSQRPLLIAALLCALFAGCTMLPEWRVGQKKIDPALAEKPAQQVEAERRAAQWLAIHSAMVEPDARQQLLDIHGVASALSASLGEPKEPVAAEDKDAIIAELRRGIRAEQKKAEAWKAFALKYAHKPVEGTGVDLAPWGGGLGLVLIAAACIFVPGFGTLVLFVIRRLRGAVQQIAQGVEEYAIEHPEKAAELKEYLSSAMDRPAKAIMKREKQFLDHTNLHELLRKKAAPTTP
jgi:hypothetical protein